MSYLKRLLALCLLLLVLPALAQEAKPPEPLQYVIASHEELAQDRWQDFIIDYLPLKNTGMRVSLHAGNGDKEALHRWSLNPSGLKPRTFRFDGSLRGKPLAAGDYVFRFAVPGSKDKPYDVKLRLVAPEIAPPLSPTTQGDYLPRDMSDQAIWQAMMAPLVVVDIGPIDHMALRDRPGGKKIGEVHGQTAGLVLRRVEDSHALVGAYATDCGSYIEGYVSLNKIKLVRPDSRYGLLIDKQRQTLAVYERGQKLGEVSISTGLMARHRLLRETRAGAFLTADRQMAFSSGGFRYDYAIRIDGGNLIHQQGWTRQDGYDVQTATLGQKASTGCVRVAQQASPEGLNALWLWTHLPRNTKVLVLDDPDAREARLEELFPGRRPEGFSKAMPNYVPAAGSQVAPPVAEATQAEDAQAEGSPAEAPQATRAAAGSTQMLFTFTGDCTLGSEEKSRKKPESFDSFIAEKGYEWPFSGLQQLLSADDLSIINFEGVLKDDTRGKAEQRLHWFRGPTEFAKILPVSSIELAGLANNHVFDYGNVGRASTKQALEEAGIPYFGYGDLYIYEKNGIKVGFGGIRETIWKRDKQLAAQEIAQLKEQGCHYIVYACHFGTEYKPVNKLQQEIAHQLVDAGADIIIGTHPHVVQGIEQYKDGLIVYSLGNFIFGGNLKLTEFEALVLQLELDFDGQALQQTKLRLIPVFTTGTRPDNDFRPIVAQGEDKARILARIQEQSKLDIQEEMVFVRP